jgi:sigma-B regulation protein RsbU (phosphoserine phosphatase)
MALGTLLLFLVGCLVGYIAEIQDKERERRLESQLLVANYQREIDLSSQLQPLLFESQSQNTQSPDAQNLDIGVATKAARELGGGDYVDAIALGENKTLICIADVSGKSVRAQARLPLLKYALRALAPLHHAPADLVKNLNETLAPDLQPELYIAFCCAVIDGKQGVLRWCNAGHIAPLLIESRGGESSIQPLETCGPPLGLFPELEYSEREMKWHESDQLLFYTDGLSDALSFNNTEDGEAQVRRLAARLSQETRRPINEVADDFIALAGAALEAADELPERLRAGFISSLKKLRAPATPSNAEGAGHRDDITVVVVRPKSAA